MAGGVHVLDSADRKNDSEFHFVIRLFIDCSIDCPLPVGTILRMNALEPLFPSRHALFPIKAIYAIPLLGKMHGLSSRDLPNPAPRMREPLRFRQITFASPQRLFRLLVPGGVHHRSNKLEFSRLISFSMSHNVDMFDGTIRHQQSVFKIKVLSILGRALDYLFHKGCVFRMEPLESKFHGRFRSSVVLEDSKGFLRPDDLAVGRFPAEASCMTEP